MGCDQRSDENVPPGLLSKPRLVVHGGAGLIDESRLEAALEGCRHAAETGARVLGNGALAAVVAAVKDLESNPQFNAGFGATLTREATTELDAAVMTGDLRFGAIAACPPVPSAIELALAVLEDGEHSLLGGAGAADFAREVGIELLDADALQTPRVLQALDREIELRRGGQRTEGAGTVGAVAVDASGGLAAATSTGGILYKRVGRIGDTPIIGAGTYADDEAGVALSATGHGESILKVMLCRMIAELLASGSSLSEACEAGIGRLGSRVGGKGGVIGIDSEGNGYAARNTAHMPWATADESSVESGH